MRSMKEPLHWQPGRSFSKTKILITPWPAKVVPEDVEEEEGRFGLRRSLAAGSDFSTRLLGSDESSIPLGSNLSSLILTVMKLENIPISSRSSRTVRHEGERKIRVSVGGGTLSEFWVGDRRSCE